MAVSPAPAYSSPTARAGQNAANSFQLDNIIIKQYFRLLVNKLVLWRMVRRDAEKRFVPKNGASIRLEKPFRTRITDGPIYEAKPLYDEHITLEVDQHKHWGFDITQVQRRLELQNEMSRYLASGVAQMCQVADAYIGNLIPEAYLSVGTPGSAINQAAIRKGDTLMSELAFPYEKRMGVLNPSMLADIANELVQDLNLRDSVVNKAYMMGYRGKVAMINLSESVNLYYHTTGNFGRAATNTPLTVHSFTPPTSSSVQGARGRMTIAGLASSQSEALRPGDVLEIDGRYMVNPQNYDQANGIGRKMQIVVTGNAAGVREPIDSTAAGRAEFSFGPSLNDGSRDATAVVAVSGTGANAKEIKLDAFKNISSYPATGDTITPWGAPDTTYHQGLLFNPEAIDAAMPALQLSTRAPIARYIMKHAMAITLTSDYSLGTHEDQTRIDLIWGAKMTRPELAIRIWGQAVGT